jgi:hypothetical protein
MDDRRAGRKMMTCKTRKLPPDYFSCYASSSSIVHPLIIFAESEFLMRPILMIEGLKNLHDARYCAAVGISMASFRMYGEDGLTPSAVKEISDWLSGLECIGEFGHQQGTEINEKAKAAGLERIILPWDFDAGEAAKIDAHILWEVSASRMDASFLGRMQNILKKFPETLFLLSFEPEWAIFENERNLLTKCILRYDDPDAIYRQLQHHGLQPFGFSLGAFAADNTGQLDYDACDAFIHQYEELVPA